MPTPIGDCVSLSLLNALSGRKAGGDEISELDMLLTSGSKRALTTNVEYELADNQFANSLSAMKAKYLCLSPKPSPKKNGLSLGNSNFLNGNGIKNGTNGTNGTSNGVKNGNGVNGVKVNPDSILPSPKIVLFPPEKVCLGWRGKPPVGAGMYNLGNTCYLNSVLQALFHVPAFVNWLLSDGDHRKKCEAENGPSCGDCLTCALAKTLVTSRSSEIMKPELITSKLRMICRSLSIGSEEDAHEFMRYLLENVEKGYLKRCPQKKLDPYSRETTPINQIFGGYLRTEVTCRNCGNVSTTFQHFQDLLLDIRKVCKVDDALDQYFGKESLDGPNAYRCEKCQQFSQATKKFSIERPPKVLCVQLKRFTGSGNKIQKSIEVKMKLSLQKYLNPASSHHATNIPLKYKLIAMVTHSGQSAGGGHYTAIAETASSSYYLFDDASVRQIPLTSVLNTSAYILFFEMEQAAALNGQRENLSGGKAMIGKAVPNKATPSTITSNGNCSSNGSSYSTNRKWEGGAPPSQTSAPPQAQRPPPFQPQPQPRLIIHSKKSKLSLDKAQDKPVALSRPEAELKNENRPGFIGPRLPADVGASSAPPPPPPADEPAPKRRCLDALATLATAKVPDEKTNGKPAKQLVPYEDDSSSSESSLSPAPDSGQSLTAKATTPHDWQVTVSPSVRNSPSVSSEGSTKTNWNVTSRPSPHVRKSKACSSDSEVDSNAGDSKLSRAPARPDELPGVHTIPPTPAELQSTNGVREKYLKKKPDGDTDYTRANNDVRNNWKDRPAEKEHHHRNSYRSEEDGDSHLRWRNGSGSWNGSGGGGPGRSDAFARNQAASNGLSDRGMHHNGVDSSDVVSQLSRMSHTGINGRILTWSNERSNLDRSVEEDRRLDRRRKDSDYDDELDRGRAKKMRTQPRDFVRSNPFNQYQNQRPYHSRNNHNRYHPYKVNGYHNGKKSHYNHKHTNRPFRRPY